MNSKLQLHGVEGFESVVLSHPTLQTNATPFSLLPVPQTTQLCLIWRLFWGGGVRGVVLSGPMTKSAPSLIS